MNLKSMTGFARSLGSAGSLQWAWEAKTVNAKGLDLRLRLPPGFDGLEQAARGALAQRLSRGTCYATLAVQRASAPAEARVNLLAARAVIKAARELAAVESLSGLSIDGLFAIRGIIDVVEATESEEGRREIEALLIDGLTEALDQLVAMRSAEGAQLGETLKARLATIARLVEAAECAPGRKPDAVRARLARLVAEISGAADRFDDNRLYQEALLMAAKADVREEIDRLAAHVQAAGDLLESREPVGRRLDFLAQELAREANTLCAKSNDSDLTTIGLEMRVEIEQFREQVQNVE